MLVRRSIEERLATGWRDAVGGLPGKFYNAVWGRSTIKPKHPAFLIVAPSYTHKSAGVRALYRLCYHLNAAGYFAAMTPIGRRIKTLPDWPVAVYRGSVEDSIVVYPEVISGNPLKADKVVRWVLNTPKALYSDEEMVFAMSPAQLPTVGRYVSKPLGSNRVQSLGLIDPAHIYPDPSIEKTLDCYFTHKGTAIRARWPLTNEANLRRIEDITPTMASLGDVLRRTRTLYSYDHKSTILKEAVICGCRVLVVHEGGQLLDPEKCGCVENNVYWGDGLRENYAKRYHDSTFVEAFVKELATRWHLTKSI